MVLLGGGNKKELKILEEGTRSDGENKREIWIGGLSFCDRIIDFINRLGGGGCGGGGYDRLTLHKTMYSRDRTDNQSF